MFGKLGVPELLIILVIVLLIFGAGKLPEVGKSLGKSIRAFKDSQKSDEEKTEEPKAKSESVVKSDSAEVKK